MSDNNLYGVSFVGPDIGAAAGDNGTILRTNTGGVLGVEEPPGEAARVPRGAVLEQNYPNPFNPVTAIRYSVPRQGFVTLKVYDVLGREVAALVNETRQAGVYTSIWEPHGIPSGMYFCRLVAGTFVETKKMLMLR